MPKPGTWRLLLLLLLPACEAVAAEPRESLWTRALRLYKQGRHEQACPLFEQVVRKAPGNGTAWADLGLCEARRGWAPEAIRANLEAVRQRGAARRRCAPAQVRAGQGADSGRRRRRDRDLT